MSSSSASSLVLSVPVDSESSSSSESPRESSWPEFHPVEDALACPKCGQECVISTQRLNSARFICCDLCSELFRPSRARWHCQPCDFDACWDCRPPFEHEELEGQQQVQRERPSFVFRRPIQKPETEYARRILKHTFHCHRKYFLSRGWDFSPNFPSRLHGWNRLRSGQRVGSYPGHWAVSVKSELHLTLSACKAKYGEDALPFWPRTLSLPEEIDALRSLISAPETSTWILKPNLSRGRGIRIVTGIDQLDAPDVQRWLQRKAVVAQRYITNSLLVDGYKCSFRIYALITSLDPFRVYMFPEGIVRICSSRFSVPDAGSAADKYSHIDSIDINHKRHKQFAQERTCDIPGVEGLRMLVGSFLEWQGVQRGVPRLKDTVMHDIALLVYRSLFAGLAGGLKRMTKKYEGHPGNAAWMLFGFDVLLDEDERVWLLEINSEPSLAPHTRLEEGVKIALLEDLFGLVDCTGRDAARAAALLAQRYPNFRAFQRRAMAAPVSTDVPALQQLASTELPLLRAITKRDFRQLIEMEMELLRCGRWLPLFLPENIAESLPMIQPDRSQIAHRWLRSGLHTQLFDQPIE